MEILPLFNYVVLERETLQSTTSIIIPRDADKRLSPSTGKVKAVGRMCEPDIKKLVGCEVLFKQHAGAWVKTPDGDEYFSLQEEDIIGQIIGESK